MGEAENQSIRLSQETAEEMLSQVERQIRKGKEAGLQTGHLMSVREHLVRTYGLEGGLSAFGADGRNATILEVNDPEIPASLRSPMDHV